MQSDIETAIESKEPFNPLSDCNQVFIFQDYLKKEHQLPDKIIYVKDGNKIVSSYYLAGRIVRDEKSKVYFMYGQPKNLDRSISPFPERRIQILKIYEGVSLDSFFEAEKIYRRTKSFKSVDKFLVNEDLQEIEKLNKVKKSMLK